MTSGTGYPEGVWLTSADGERPTELIVVPGTPVVDTADQVCGVAMAMTPGFCLMRPRKWPHPLDENHGEPGDSGTSGGGDENDCGGSLYAVAWRDVAVGNVCAARAVLPRSLDQRDQWDSYAKIVEHIDHAQAFGELRVLTAARRALLHRLMRGG